MYKFLRLGKKLNKQEEPLLDSSNSPKASLQASPTILRLDDDETRLLIDITVAARHKYRTQPWTDRFLEEVKYLNYDELSSFRSDTVEELAELVEKELPCFWAGYLDGLSRLPVAATYDEISQSMFYGYEPRWLECAELEDGDSRLLDDPASDADCDKTALLALKLLAACPDFNWNTQDNNQRAFPEYKDFLSLLSTGVNLSKEISESLHKKILEPYLDEALSIQELEDGLSNDKKLISELVVSHKSELLSEYRRSLRLVKYGSIDSSRGLAVAEEFVRLTNLTERLSSTGEREAVKQILQSIRLIYEKECEPIPSVDAIPTDPVEFEIWCLKMAKNAGFSGHLTAGSGDQGVDVILRGPNLSLGIQCKRVVRPSGNSAVQEIIAGVRHYNLDHGLVVSTAGFTRSARELAISCDVSLCLAQDLIHTLTDLAAKARPSSCT